MHRRYLIFFLLAAALVYGLTVATNSGSPLSEYFWHLIVAGGLMVAVLLAMLLRYGWLLLRHNQYNMLGSRLARRLALMFCLVAVLPALFLFGVSAQFISYSIHSWFGNDTAQALESSLTLSKSALDAALDDSVRRAAGLQIEVISAVSMGGDGRRPSDRAAKPPHSAKPASTALQTTARKSSPTPPPCRRRSPTAIRPRV